MQRDARRVRKRDAGQDYVHLATSKLRDQSLVHSPAVTATLERRVDVYAPLDGVPVRRTRLPRRSPRIAGKDAGVLDYEPGQRCRTDPAAHFARLERRFVKRYDRGGDVVVVDRADPRGILGAHRPDLTRPGNGGHRRPRRGLVMDS